MRKHASGQGSVAASVGDALVLVITPKATFTLDRILASGDTGATITSMFSGEEAVVLDALDVAQLGVGAFHAPTFEGRTVRAGVPVTVNYTAGSTTSALRLTLSGDAP